MNLWKRLIRIWLTLASLMSFLVGWAVLAHAPKPNQVKPMSVPALPKLDPVPSLDQLMPSDDESQQVFLPPSRPSQRMPVLRSGGS